MELTLQAEPASDKPAEAPLPAGWMKGIAGPGSAKKGKLHSGLHNSGLTGNTKMSQYIIFCCEWCLSVCEVTIMHRSTTCGLIMCCAC